MRPRTLQLETKSYLCYVVTSGRIVESAWQMAHGPGLGRVIGDQDQVSMGRHDTRHLDPSRALGRFVGSIRTV